MNCFTRRKVVHGAMGLQAVDPLGENQIPQEFNLSRGRVHTTHANTKGDTSNEIMNYMKYIYNIYKDHRVRPLAAVRKDREPVEVSAHPANAAGSLSTSPDPSRVRAIAAVLTGRRHCPGRPHHEEVMMTHALAQERLLSPPPPASQIPETPTLFALDLGTTTGWALRARTALITSGTGSFRPAASTAAACATCASRNWLTEIDRLAGPRRGDLRSRRSAATRAPMRPRLRRAHGDADRMVRAARHPLRGRPGRHDQAPRRRQGQRQQGRR